MPSFLIIFAFIFGAIIGSFLNVVAFRFKTGMTMNGRSKCFSCNKTLTWLELFPILSFLFQGGKCKKCKSRISCQYPLVEAATGILFTLIFCFFPPISIAAGMTTIFYLFITSLLVVITIYDIRHKIIPDVLAYTFAAVAFIYMFFGPELFFHIPSVFRLLAGPLLALPFFLLWLCSKGKWMGLGDAKLVLGIGWTLGLSAGVSAIALAFWIGAIISVFWMAVIFRKFKTHYEIPFGPYLILGMYIVLLFGVRVFDTQLLISLFSS